MSVMEQIYKKKKIPSEFNKTVSNNFNKWIKGSFGDRTYEIYPNVFQNSDSFREFRYNLFQEVMESCKDIGDVEFSSATPLLGEMGQSSSHILLPFNETSVVRRELGLRKVDEKDKEDVRWLIIKVIENAEIKSISVKDKSSSGYPYFIKGVGFKLSECASIFKEVHEIFKLCKEKNIEKLIEKMDLPLYTLGTRYQLDRINYDNKTKVASCAKERKWFSPEFVNSNGEKGDSGLIDYTVISEAGAVDKRFVSARTRSMYALAYKYNCILQVINNYLMSGLKKIAPEVNYTTPELTVSELGGFDGKEFLTGDYGNYGETIPGELVEIIAEELDRKYEGLGNFIRLTYDAPALIRGFEKNKNEPFIIGEKEFFSVITSSLKSGNGLVAFIGKFFSVKDNISIFRRLIPRFDRIKHLNNDYPYYKRKSSSDDNLFKIRDIGLERDFKEHYSGLSLFKAELTSSPIFLGFLYLVSKVTRDISRLLERLTNMERSFRTKMFFELGIGCSILEYTNNKFFQPVYGILKKHFKVFKIDLEAYVREANTLATPTAIFLANPESVFYKLDPDLINDTIYKQFFSHISEEKIRYYYGGIL